MADAFLPAVRALVGPLQVVGVILSGALTDAFRALAPMRSRSPPPWVDRRSCPHRAAPKSSRSSPWAMAFAGLFNAVAPLVPVILDLAKTFIDGVVPAITPLIPV